MGTYEKQMFNTTGESTTLADLNERTLTTTGTFTPDYDGALLEVRLQWSGEAVTSLAENVRVELKCNIWNPNLQEFGMVMANIRTAPAFPIPDASFMVNQPIKTTQAISGQYAFDNAATPVTSHLVVFGQFSGP